MSFDDFEDFDDESVMFGQGRERKTIAEEIADFEDELAGREDLIEAQFRLVNPKENKRNKDAKMNKANKWKIKG